MPVTSKRYRNLERLAWVLDSSIRIPGLNVRIGLDGLLGLIPGFGDTLGALLSSSLLAEAARLGAPRSVLLKMALNIAIDALLGAIPILGDLFDFAWKANQRNLALLERYFDEPRRTTISSGLLVAGLVLLLVAFVAFIGWVVYLILSALYALAVGG